MKSRVTRGKITEILYFRTLGFLDNGDIGPVV
jgi:hypothetical protein